MGDSKIEIGDIVSLIEVYTNPKRLGIPPYGLVTNIEQAKTRDIYTVEWFDDGSTSGESRDNIRKA